MTGVLSRRTFRKASVAAGVAASSLVACTSEDRSTVAATGDPDALRPFRWSEASIDEMQAAMQNGEASAAT